VNIPRLRNLIMELAIRRSQPDHPRLGVEKTNYIGVIVHPYGVGQINKSLNRLTSMRAGTKHTFVSMNGENKASHVLGKDT
jgi:hypothetical protein